jgi:hypothetical protein
MKRGTDEFGIESICEVATPIIIDQKTGQQLPFPVNGSPPPTNGNLNIMDSYSRSNINQEISSGVPSIFDVFK